ncbi:hypothetical protein [Pararhodobacter sp. CCB-MM2]|uniref:hypothetical protein n=1 Tax=Pararhodobacter sp. CCB-MM2 TaxID=1786003 RepID=UPI0008338311|nr:hypothetical protein [Pararhodobacter sp. CCB-MM2]MCA2014094.1 hypothetical protein [Cereibacter sphaeroides]
MPLPRFLLRTSAVLATAAFLAGCSASGENLGASRDELGDFRLCYNIVTTNDAVQGPLSREADVEVFADRIRDEIDRRFGRYEGDRLFHIALHLDAYVLAVPGVPLIASPRSALIVSANLWDDALGGPVNDGAEQFTILESAGGSSVVGSGLTMSAEEQMTMLAQNAALRIETWMSEHPEWFDPAQRADQAVDGDSPATAEAAAEPEAEPATSAASSGPEGSAGAACGRR